MDKHCADINAYQWCYRDRGFRYHYVLDEDPNYRDYEQEINETGADPSLRMKGQMKTNWRESTYRFVVYYKTARDLAADNEFNEVVALLKEERDV
ncbi:MAG: hypothetical protein MMC33_001595 [Icmadophila ericetorum]|nr:hypothetical protein [Icmadophila ericetorum]